MPGSPGGDGQSWNTPYKFLRDALADTEGVTEIRVGQGTYLPDRDEANPDGTGDREATFQLISGVSLVGGYLGTSAGPGEIPNARDIAQYETILSGDLLGDDGPDFENNDENSHHVLTATDAFNTLLDGFTVLGGNSDLGGAGLRAEGSTLTVNQCRAYIPPRRTWDPACPRSASGRHSLSAVA